MVAELVFGGGKDRWVHIYMHINMYWKQTTQKQMCLDVKKPRRRKKLATRHSPVHLYILLKQNSGSHKWQHSHAY